MLVFLWSLCLSLVTLGPLLGRGYWLWADAVSVPRSGLTDQALGLAEAAPRATPQDAALATASAVVDGGGLVKAITLLALLAAGTGAARLVRAVLPETGLAAQLVAATFAVDNLWVAERLLQGQWSLLLGYGALGHVAVVARSLRDVRGLRQAGSAQYGVLPQAPAGWVELGFWLAVGGFVPTGWFFVAAVAAAVLVLPGGARPSAHQLWLFGALALATASPWLAAGLLGESAGQLGSAGASGVAAFAARPDRFGWLALGGIWNAQSVPASQGGLWGLAADLVLVALVVCGAFLLRDQRCSVTVAPGGGVLFRLGIGAVVFVGLSATTLGGHALSALVEQVPGLGVLRDTQKWSALAWPAYALALGACGHELARRGRAWAIVLVPVVLLLVPDALWGAGSRLEPVQYPAGWSAVRAAVTSGGVAPSRGAVLTLPAGIVRRYAFTGNQVSIDPAPRLLPVPVFQTGDLVVSSEPDDSGGRTTTVPGEGELARRAAADVQRGAEPEQLARDGVGWVLVERDQLGELPAVAQGCLDRFELAYADPDLALYRNPQPAWPVPQVSQARRDAVVLAHILWAALLIVGGVWTIWGRARTLTSTAG